MSRPALRPLAPGRPALGLAAAVLLAAGCGSARFHKSPALDPRVPLRVAVLPFVDRSSEDDLLSRPLAAAIDLVPILSDDELTRRNAATVFRLRLHDQLARTSLDVLDLPVVDSALSHRRLDAAPFYDGPRDAAARALGDALAADAVLFGEVTAWNREYYLVEAIVRAGLRVELRDAATGGVLFEGEVEEVEASGVSKLPIVYSPEGEAQSILGESLKGLRNTQFAALADEVSRRLVEGIGPTAAERAAGLAPAIHFVAHGGDRPLAPGDALHVVALGDAGARASFRIGRGPEHPLTETAPGRYRGALAISPAHRFEGEPLTVRLESAALVSATMTVGRPPLRTAPPLAGGPSASLCSAGARAR